MEQQLDGFAIGRAQEEQRVLLTALSKSTIDEFFRPLLLVEHPDNPFVQNTEALNILLNNFDSGFTRHLECAISDVKNNNEHVQVAVSNEKPDELLGFCAFTKKEDCVYINMIIVSQYFRNKGIGKALMDSVLSTYKDNDLYKLKTFAYGNAAVCAFYEKLGFENKGICTLIEGAPNTHILYQLDLKK